MNRDKSTETMIKALKSVVDSVLFKYRHIGIGTLKIQTIGNVVFAGIDA